ncbi:MAG: fatty acid cis/trans isomerase [Gammaproteobacteria bacterium]|nr:fatty acid cis/trans isomerase [Gammaproteobacteria bacterium]NNJ50145.1 isomerase [Gammaproteobacteria bacterium]
MKIFVASIIKQTRLLTGLILLSFFLSACSSSEKSITAEQATVEYDLLYTLPEEKISFKEEVQPVLENRCVVCHGCYDAPCQLKLTSAEGIHRGSNKEKVYDAARLTAAEPTRLFIDAMTTEEWRQKGFEPVLNEGEANKVRNLEDSVLYRMLRQKQLYPQARTGMLSDDFDVTLDRAQTCPTVDEFDDYAAKHPKGGMPYALPNLSREEHTTLVHWLAQGAPMPDDDVPSKIAEKQIEQWEALLNQGTSGTSDNKARLVARYLYEHLFQAHLHFEGTDDREFYRLVRSSTASGKPVEVIATRRPYNDPAKKVYYRIIRHQGSIVAKTHMVYDLSDKRMQRLKELFYDAEYEVTSLPSYKPDVASNPIKAFAAIPVSSRYKFLLDEARFFIEGFIKGPVCRGQTALSVIEDQFWVVFFDPDADIMMLKDEFLNKTADYLASPAELEDNFKLLASKTHYKTLIEEYFQSKVATVKNNGPVDIRDAMDYIWKGGGKNPNAALTIFRHLDSASVNFGFIGDYPETAWVIDYSVLERIHYLLVAGYDVYGNLGHQLNARLYMDFLRTEGEDYFLTFLPVEKRQLIRDGWNQGIRQGDGDIAGVDRWMNMDFVSGYRTDNPQRELYQHLERHLGPLAGDGDFINRCRQDECQPEASKEVLRADKAMQRATEMEGLVVKILPDVAFVRVKMGGKPKDDIAYTMISNKAYHSVTSMFQHESLHDRRDYRNDTQTVVRWLEGSYPDFFYVVEIDDIENFVDSYNAIENRKDYEQFVARYGQRRTSEDFWQHADWFNRQYSREQPRLSGIFDLNRYQNR